MIAIIDYGMGNLGSVKNMFKKAGVCVSITRDIAEIQVADKLVLPGVGAFDSGMRNLDDLGLIPVLNDKVCRQKTPILGICLGMQLMGCNSSEGELPGLGWIESHAERFVSAAGQESSLKVPHMGWNGIKPVKASVLLRDMYEEPRFYFVHSYHVICHQPDDVLSYTFYGREFVSAFEQNNISGVQFHPEKSHKYGMRLLKNFAEAF